MHIASLKWLRAHVSTVVCTLDDSVTPALWQTVLQTQSSGLKGNTHPMWQQVWSMSLLPRSGLLYSASMEAWRLRQRLHMSDHEWAYGDIPTGVPLCRSFLDTCGRIAAGRLPTVRSVPEQITSFTNGRVARDT